MTAARSAGTHKCGLSNTHKEPPEKSMCAMAEAVENAPSKRHRLEMDCFFGEKLRLTEEASNELRKFKFSFDADCGPISRHSPYVHVLIEYTAVSRTHKKGHFVSVKRS